jgi:hypothetical protein
MRKLAAIVGVAVVIAVVIFGLSSRPAAQISQDYIQSLLDQRYELKAVFPDGKDRLLYFQKGNTLRVCSQTTGGCSRLSKD